MNADLNHTPECNMGLVEGAACRCGGRLRPRRDIPARTDDETVPCGTCGTPTLFVGTKRCSPCWEIEQRLESYLVRGGPRVRAFVRRATTAALALRRKARS